MSGVLPWGVRPLSTLRAEDVAQSGEELRDLVALRAAGIPCVDGWLVALSGNQASERLGRALEIAASTSPAGQVLLRPMFPTRALALRFERRGDLSSAVGTPAEIPAAVTEFLARVGTPEVTAALGGSLARLSALVTVAEEPTRGRAASCDPADGDPDRIRVWETAVSPWLVDRKTTRVLARGEGRLDEQGASSVADLADRAQLVLGLPVEITWVVAGGRPVVEGVRGIAPAPRFAAAPHRIVVLISEDEGCVSPLAVDSLDKALRREADLPEEPRVRRIYARPYRRMDGPVPVRRRTGDPVSIAKAAARAARVATDVATPIAAARAFERGLSARLAELDGADLGALDDRALVEALRERQRLVVEAFVLLDRGRLATIAVLAALEAAVGPLPRDALPALARPKVGRPRRRLHDRMARLVRRIEAEHGELVPPDRLSAPLRSRWDDLRRDLAGVRPLGIDIRPLDWGADDASFAEALRSAPWEEDESRERARKGALRRIMATARQRSFGRSREAIAGSLGLLVFRVAREKGATAEGLAAAMLRLRRAACEAGRRLAELGLVDEPEDALYLSLDEIAQGLAGEPGAYAARVRLRREDDLRWACFNAPRRISARR